MNKSSRINELLTDSEFQEKSKTITTKEELTALFSEFGVEMSPEEIDVFLIQLGKILTEGESTELTESELEDVSGGGAVAIVLTGAAASAFGIAVGATILVGILAIGGYALYKKFKKKK